MLAPFCWKREHCHSGRPSPSCEEVNDALTFTNHSRNVTKIAAWRLSCVRRIFHLLDAWSISALYAAEVRSVMQHL